MSFAGSIDGALIVLFKYVNLRQVDFIFGVIYWFAIDVDHALEKNVIDLFVDAVFIIVPAAAV